MKQIKVSDLEGKQVAEWAARAQKWVYKETPDDLEYLGCGSWYTKNLAFIHIKKDYRPDINGTQAMELKKRFKISDTFTMDGKWHASVVTGVDEYSGYPDDFVEQLGDTPELAITRAAIASVFGETVTVEDE